MRNKTKGDLDEVIVIDDASKDNTLKVAESYAEKASRLRVFHKEYITFLDSDDWFEYDAIEKLLDIQTDNSSKIAVANVYTVSIYEKNCKFYRFMQNYLMPS